MAQDNKPPTNNTMGDVIGNHPQPGRALMAYDTGLPYDTGRNLPTIRQQPREPEPSITNEKTIGDFTRVVGV